MAIWDFRPRGDLLTTVAVGVGVVAAPVVLPLAWSAVRPLLKTVLKGGFLLYETGRGACAEAAKWTGLESAEEAPAAKPTKAAERATARGRNERAFAQNVGALEEQLTGKQPQERPARPKAKRKPKKERAKAEKQT